MWLIIKLNTNHIWHFPRPFSNQTMLKLVHELDSKYQLIQINKKSNTSGQSYIAKLKKITRYSTENIFNNLSKMYVRRLLIVGGQQLTFRVFKKKIRKYLFCISTF